MKYTTLGHSGIGVSKIALGTMDFGTLIPENEAFKILDAFIENGGNMVDTSNVYGGGIVEEVIGRWFASRSSDVTDKVVLCSKGRFSPNPDINATGSSRRALSRDLEGSLQRLGRDHVDLYQLHAWDPITPIEESLQFLDDAVRAGKVLYVGLSNFTGWQLQLAISTAKKMGLVLPVTLQQQYSLLSRESEWEVIPAARYNHVGILVWSPLAGGFLTGKYKRGAAPASNTRAGSKNPLYEWVSGDYAAKDRNWETIREVVRIANELGATPAQVALRWLMDQPMVVAPITCARTAEAMVQNLGAVDLKLSDEQRMALANVPKPICGGYPYGVFGQGQRSRDFVGNGAQNHVVGKGHPFPTGQVQTKA